MSTQAVLDQIGYVAWHGIRVTEERVGKISVSLPARDDLLNYVGTGHAGAIFTLAETAAGVAADSVAQTLGAFILLQQAALKYTRRAQGELIAAGEASAPAVQAASDTFAREGRAELPIEVVVRDADAEPVFEGTFHYALRPRKS